MNKRIAGLLKPYRGKVIFAVIIGVVSSLMSVLIPQIVRTISSVIEEGLKSKVDFSSLSFNAVLAFGAVLIVFAFGYAQQFMMAGVSQDLCKNMRRDISAKLNRLPIVYFDSHKSGDTLSRVSNDVDMVSQSLVSNITSILSSMTTVIGATVMMLITNWILALCVMVVSIGGFAISRKVAKAGRNYARTQQRSLGAINAHIEEVFTGHLVVKAFNCEDDVREYFHKRNQDMYESSWKSQVASGIMTPVMAFVGNLGYIIVCIVGAALIVGNIAGTTISVIVAFILYVRMYQSNISNVASAIGSIQPAYAAAGRVFEILDEDEIDESGATETIQDVSGEIGFSHVKFGYVPNTPILHDFSADVKSGQKVAIVGPTGAGKTTMVNLLMRFYELDGGEIRIDGTPVSKLHRDNLHDYVGMVLQDTWTFEGSIRDNIVYSTKGVTEERLREVIEDVGLDHFVDTLPNGLDTILGEQTEVSAGQKQLLTIARAMIRNPKVLILDEATSSIDTRLEKIITQAIDKLTEGRTSFVIAHRLSTIRDADVIFVMKDGDVVETGKHEELLQRNGLYAQLYNSQFDEGE